jgi:hypothetical protein
MDVGLSARQELLWVFTGEEGTCRTFKAGTDQDVGIVPSLPTNLGTWCYCQEALVTSQNERPSDLSTGYK